MAQSPSRSMHLLGKNDFPHASPSQASSSQAGERRAVATSSPDAGAPSPSRVLAFGPSLLHRADFVFCSGDVPSPQSAERNDPKRARVTSSPSLNSILLTSGASRSSHYAVGTVRALQEVSGSLLKAPIIDFVFDGDTPPESVVHHRERLAGVVQSCLQEAWTPGTRSTYEAMIAKTVGDAQLACSMNFLPLDSDTKLMLLFAQVDGAPWSTIQVLKCAIRAWHLERNCLPSLSLAWSERAYHFWAGLKRRADHSRSRAKRPLALGELLQLQKRRLAACTPAGLRDAAAAAVCFFCVRRSAEMLAFDRSDVIYSSHCLGLLVRRQKNDPCGVGMKCWLPRLPSLGHLCPASLLQLWCDEWDHWWQPAIGNGPLFSVTGGELPKMMSYDSWRKVVTPSLHGNSVKDVGSHSLRKGGAVWLKTQCRLSEDIVQAQGGWSSPEVMRKFYAGLSDDERRCQLVQAFARAEESSEVVLPSPVASPTASRGLPVWRRPF